MKKAEITVFLSMALILTVSFILGILQITVIHTSKNMSLLETDRAVFSLFGEYQRNLLEDYKIFAIEGTYETGDFSEERLIGRMHYYGSGNTDHEVTGIQFLTDNHGQAFREQVTAYMEECYGIGLIRDFTGMTAEWEEQCIEGEKIQAEEEKVTEQFEELKKAAEEASSDMPDPTEEDPDAESEEIGNPFQCIEQIEKTGILSVVMPEEMELSGKEISLEDQVSMRSLNTGYGSFPARTGIDGIEGRLLFNEYILQNFGNAAGKRVSSDDSGDINVKDTEEDQLRSLEYEVEYIISGKASDRENLESVLTKVFLIRLALNYVYLLGDSGKQAEAEALAATIALLLLMPEGTEVIKQLILFAWAAGESTVDIRTLLNGKRAALVKTKENWQVSLPELLTLGSSSGKNGDGDIAGGVTYEDYLRIFLFMEDQDQTAMRTLDRIEENLAAVQGMDRFRTDCCITKLGLKNTGVIFGDITYTYPAYFGYE